MDTWVDQSTDEFFEDLFEEAQRRVDAWLDERRPFPPCFELSQEKYDLAVRDQAMQLFEGWMMGDFIDDEPAYDEPHSRGVLGD